MSPLFTHILLIFQQYLLHTAGSSRIVLHSVVIEDVCESCFDLVVVVADLVIRGIGGIAKARH